MTDRLYAKYIWLISTIHDAGKISFEDIACKWDDAYINDLHQPLKLRTFHNHRNAILYSFIDGSHLDNHNPTKLFGMKWMSECTVEDGATQRLFVAHSKAEDNKHGRLLFCTYPFEKVSYAIQKCTKLLLNWFLLSPQKEIFE